MANPTKALQNSISSLLSELGKLGDDAAEGILGLKKTFLSDEQLENLSKMTDKQANDFLRSFQPTNLAKYEKGLQGLRDYHKGIVKPTDFNATKELKEGFTGHYNIDEVKSNARTQFYTDLFNEENPVTHTRNESKKKPVRWTSEAEKQTAYEDYKKRKGNKGNIRGYRNTEDLTESSLTTTAEQVEKIKSGNNDVLEDLSLNYRDKTVQVDPTVTERKNIFGQEIEYTRQKTNKEIHDERAQLYNQIEFDRYNKSTGRKQYEAQVRQQKKEERQAILKEREELQKRVEQEYKPLNEIEKRQQEKQRKEEIDSEQKGFIRKTLGVVGDGIKSIFGHAEVQTDANGAILNQLGARKTIQSQYNAIVAQPYIKGGPNAERITREQFAKEYGTILNDFGGSFDTKVPFDVKAGMAFDGIADWAKEKPLHAAGAIAATGVGAAGLYNVFSSNNNRGY